MIGYVISDLHIGGGEADQQLEDFFQDDALVAFIDGARGPGATLVINGDFIDFAQIPPYDVPEPRHLLSQIVAQKLAVLRRRRRAHRETGQLRGQYRARIGKVDLVGIEDGPRRIEAGRRPSVEELIVSMEVRSR